MQTWTLAVTAIEFFCVIVTVGTSLKAAHPQFAYQRRSAVPAQRTCRSWSRNF